MCAYSRGRAGRHHERAEEEAEDKELVNDELEQLAAKQNWPDHLDEQPTSVVKAGGLPMRDYQLEALNWLIKLHDQNLNGILAGEWGDSRLAEAAVHGPHAVLTRVASCTDGLSSPASCRVCR
jgi:hypothetical protein